VALLEVSNLTKRFGGLIALNNVSFKIEKGAIVGLIGPNGSGKTTLFNVVTGFYHPVHGKILVDGRDITGISPPRACHLGIGRTFQIVKPFASMSVRENVLTAATFSRRWHGHNLDEVCRDVLQKVKIEKLADSFIAGLPIQVRKRLELARALATNPILLLLDEVLAGLNPKEVDDALAIIREIAQTGVTIIMVEHVMRAIMAISERVMVLHHGQLIADGTAREVSQSKEVAEAYLGARLPNASG